jgi:hypothetical protein
MEYRVTGKNTFLRYMKKIIQTSWMNKGLIAILLHLKKRQKKTDGGNPSVFYSKIEKVLF